MGSSDRRPYETATVLDQALLDECSGNEVCDLRMLVLISVPTGAFVTNTLYLSDRNMVVGENFYDARLVFPPIKRNVGEILTPQITFSTVSLVLSNVDGLFNPIMPSGQYYKSFVNQRVIIKLGLGEVQSTYDANVIFDGFVTEVGGFQRGTKSFTLICRDKFDDLKAKFPNTFFTSAEYPNIGDNVSGKPKPYILGDWTTNLEIAKDASIPTFIVNGADANMNGEIGSTNNVQLVISENTNRVFDTTHVVIQRSDIAYVINAADVVNVNGNKNYFEIVQNSGSTLIEGVNFIFKQSDKFFVKIEGASIDGPNTYPDNPVEQARFILETFGGAAPGDFTANWDTLRDKAAPAQSAIVNIPSRIWVGKPVPALDTALSILEQIRCEGYINRSQEIDIQTMHWEDFDPSPSLVVRQDDIELNSFKMQIPDRNNINKAQGFFNFLPDIKEEYQATVLRQNAAAVAAQKEIIKGLVFPNLYVQTDVINQLDEYLKLISGGREDITVNQSWRVLTLDLGDWVKMDAKIQSTQFDGVPCWIRSIGFNSVGMKISLTYFSFQLLPFQTWNPGYSGIVGGQSASITDG